MIKALLLTLLIITSISSICYAIDIRIVTEAAYSKEVNGNAGLELLIKSTIKLSPDIDLKIGVSEGYTAQRANPYSLNHAGVRLDIGFLWSLPLDFQAGYAHSERSWFAGADPVDVYEYDSVDTVTIRKEFEISK